MKITRNTLTLAAMFATGLLAGCAGDMTGITTSAVDAKTGTVAAEPGVQPAAAVAGVAVDPACVTLTSQIDGLRKDGVVERVQKAAATGKTASVTVKRASLTKMAELEMANAEFQAKCATLSPKPAAQAAAPAPVTATVSGAAGAAATATVAKTKKSASAKTHAKAAALAAPAVAKAP